MRGFKRRSTLQELGEVHPHKWEPRVGGEWDPARLLGIATQVGYNWHLRGKDDEEIEEVVTAELREGFQEGGKYTLEGLSKLTLKGVSVLIDGNFFDRHRILELDEPLSHSRPDYISRSPEGLGVTDLKVAFRIDERYRIKRMSEYETDDQFWHYAWEVGEHYGEPVKWLRPLQVILTPKAQVLHEFIRVDPKRLEFWLEGARQHWVDMEAEDNGERPVVPRWPNCRGGKYGTCIFYDGCHQFGRDPQKMLTYYERVPS